jgi:hypothetical protein
MKQFLKGCAGLAVIWIIAANLPSCGTDPVKIEGRNASSESIACELLESKQRPHDKRFGADFLVSKSASKDEVAKLVESLRHQYKGKLACFSIFDSREAWSRQADETYSSDEFDQHCLVTVDEDTNVPPKVRWGTKFDKQ